MHPAPRRSALRSDLDTRDANGHVVWGPRLAPSGLARLIPDTPEAPDWARLSPDAARHQQASRRARVRRSLAQLDRSARQQAAWRSQVAAALGRVA